MKWLINRYQYIPIIFQVASLLAALAPPSHIVLYAPGDLLPGIRSLAAAMHLYM